MKIMFAGDIHGDEKHLFWLFDHAVQNEVDHIISAGDFGYWPHLKWGKHYLEKVNTFAEATGIPLYWVDGNHENHDWLDALREALGDENPIPTTTEWVKWIPRGCRFTLNGYTFMGYGGAYSVDWEDRQLGHSWWKQELINPYHLDNLSDDPVDVLITHEAPLGKEISYKDDIPVSVAQREFVLDIQNKVVPRLHVCGHHHVRETWTSNETEVHVLGRNEMGEESVLIREFV